MTTALPQNPFPGMNPYLERAGIWPEVHSRIIVGLADALTPRLYPDYAVRVQQRMYIAAEPDTNGGPPRFRIPDAMVLTGTAAAAVATQRETAAKPQPTAAVAVALPATELMPQRYLQVLRPNTMDVVAVIEVLSPSNKSGDDRSDYLAKRAEVKSSTAHLVEIDLLRAGPPMPVIGDTPLGCYRIIVANGRLRPQADLYAFGIREAIPEFVLPLASGSPGIGVDLNPVLRHIYSHGSYTMLVDYGQEPEPPLDDDDRDWLDDLLRRQGLR